MRHDAHYKRLFGHPRVTGDLLALLRDGLGERLPVLRRVEPGTLEKLPGEFVSDDLRRRLADLVWKVRLSGAGSDGGSGDGPGDGPDYGPDDHWLYLVVLMEFQSAVDWMMAARVQEYSVRLWLDMHTRKPFSPTRAPPPVLPAVVYNGGRPWNAPTRVSDLWRRQPAPPENARFGAVEAEPLKFCGDGFALLDLQAMDGDALPDDNGVAWLARIESARDEGELSAALDGVSEWLDDDADGTLGSAVLGWMRALNDAKQLLEAEEFEMAVQTAGGKERPRGHWTDRVKRDRLRSMARARAEGRKQGRKQEREACNVEWLARERALLSRQADRRFGADVAERLTPALERADHDGLTQIGDWIVEADDADQLLRRCADA